MGFKRFDRFGQFKHFDVKSYFDSFVRFLLFWQFSLFILFEEEYVLFRSLLASLEKKKYEFLDFHLSPFCSKVVVKMSFWK